MHSYIVKKIKQCIWLRYL